MNIKDKYEQYKEQYKDEYRLMENVNKSNKFLRHELYSNYFIEGRNSIGRFNIKYIKRQESRGILSIIGLGTKKYTEKEHAMLEFIKYIDEINNTSEPRQV